MYLNAEYEFDRLKNLTSSNRGAEASYKLFSAEYNDSNSSQQFQEKVRQKLTQEQFALNESESRSYSRRELSDAQVAAWSNCVSSLGGAGAVLLSPKSITNTGFSLRIERILPVGVGSAEIEIELQGGKANDQTKFKEIYSGSGSKSYVVRADSVNATVRVSANLPGLSDSILVDLKPNIATAPLLGDLIYSGKLFTVTFNALSNNIGTIYPRRSLTGTYSQGEQAWRVSGPNGPNGEYVSGNDQGLYGCGPVVPAGRRGACLSPTAYKLNLWGAVFTFDNAGVVRYQDAAVGRIAVN